METGFTARLGLRCPIISAPMGAVAGGRLAAAVSRAGGLGLIGPGYLGAEWIERGVSRRGGRAGRDRFDFVGPRALTRAARRRARASPGGGDAVVRRRGAVRRRHSARRRAADDAGADRRGGQARRGVGRRRDHRAGDRRPAATARNARCFRCCRRSSTRSRRFRCSAPAASPTAADWSRRSRSAPRAF